MGAEPKTHPAADLFPLMSDEELAALADDVKANGLLRPITLVNGMILDGRNRLRACEIAGIEPRFEDANESDPLALSVALNVKRRNLSKAQAAIAAAEAWDLVSPKKGGKHGRADVLAEMFGVGRNYVQQARALVERDPPLAAEVKAGRIPIARAHEALVEHEAVIERLRSLADETAALETLPAPGVEAVTDAERALARQQIDKSRDADGLLKWERVLELCKAASRAVRDDLPDFPEGPEEELLRIAAREQARLLEDAAARIAAKTTKTLRRVG